MNEQHIIYREQVRPEDCEHVRQIVTSTGFFSEAEIDIAVELVEDRLTKGQQSDYAFLLAEQDGKVAGYTCFGHIDGTVSSYDLYWIAVHQDARNQGVGRILLRKSEDMIAAQGGRRVYVETASRDQYAPTRAFYERCGYRQEALLEDFYGPGDGKVIYIKVLNPISD